NLVSDLLVVGRGWDDDHSLLTFETVNAQDGAKAQLFILAGGPHRHEGHPKIKGISPDTLKATLGEPTEVTASEQIRIPITIAIPPGSGPAIHLGGAEEKLGEIILDTGLSEARTMKIRVRYAIKE